MLIFMLMGLIFARVVITHVVLVKGLIITSALFVKEAVKFIIKLALLVALQTHI